MALCALFCLSSCARTLRYPDRSAGPEIAPPAWSGSASKSEPKPETKATTTTSTPSKSTLQRASDGKLPSSSSQGPEELALVMEWAHELMGSSSFVVKGKAFPKDCSGYLRATWYGAGVDLYDVTTQASTGTEIIYQYVKQYGTLSAKYARPGDLVFFHNTYDRNRNGRFDDHFSHIALVESVESNGTIVMLHVLRSGVVRSKMNLKYGDQHMSSDGSSVLNDYLRRATGRQSAMLTSQLFYRFGRVEI